VLGNCRDTLNAEFIPDGLGRKSFSDSIVMYEELIVFVLEIEIKVGQSKQIFIDKLRDFCYMNSGNAVVYLEGAVIAGDLGSDLIDFVFE
jgi:hypothetical protein